MEGLSSLAIFLFLLFSRVPSCSEFNVKYIKQFGPLGATTKPMHSGFYGLPTYNCIMESFILIVAIYCILERSLNPGFICSCHWNMLDAAVVEDLLAFFQNV